MEKQQTAVEWLEERFEKFLSYYEGHHKSEPYSIHQLSNDFEQAKQMEREQIRCAYHVGLYDSSMQQEKRFDNGLDYYTKIYGQ